MLGGKGNWSSRDGALCIRAPVAQTLDAATGEILSACIEARAIKMQLAVELPQPTSRPMLEATLATFAAKILTEVTNPKIVSVFRLAIAEATRAPQIAQTLDRVGREATFRALVRLMAKAQAGGFLASGDPAQFATEFMALAWEGLRANVMLGVVPLPARKPSGPRSSGVSCPLWRFAQNRADDLRPALSTPSSNRSSGPPALTRVQPCSKCIPPRPA